MIKFIIFYVILSTLSFLCFIITEILLLILNFIISFYDDLTNDIINKTLPYNIQIKSYEKALGWLNLNIDTPILLYKNNSNELIFAAKDVSILIQFKLLYPECCYSASG